MPRHIGLQFHYVLADTKLVNNIFIENILNAIVPQQLEPENTYYSGMP